MIEFGIGTAIGALAGWAARARLHPAPAPDAPATDSQRAYLQRLLEQLAGAQQVATRKVTDPWAPKLATKRASALLDELSALKKCVTKDRRGVFHVQENCALHGVPRGDVSLQNETIVFSGFRDDTLARQIEEAGGTVEDALTKSRTTRLLTWNRNGAPTTKIKAAQRYGKPIEHRAEFVQRFYQ